MTGRGVCGAAEQYLQYFRGLEWPFAGAWLDVPEGRSGSAILMVSQSLAKCFVYRKIESCGFNV